MAAAAAAAVAAAEEERRLVSQRSSVIFFILFSFLSCPLLLSLSAPASFFSFRCTRSSL